MKNLNKLINVKNETMKRTKKTTLSKKIDFRLNENLYRSVYAYADENDITIGDAIRQLVLLGIQTKMA